VTSRDARPPAEWTLREIASYWKFHATQTWPNLWSSDGSVKTVASILGQRQAQHPTETTEVQVRLINMFLADPRLGERVGRGQSLMAALLGFMNRNVAGATDSLEIAAEDAAVARGEAFNEITETNRRALEQSEALFGTAGPRGEAVLRSVTSEVHAGDSQPEVPHG
jgi:hypothetical protein